MPNVEKTPRQTVRIEGALWETFGRLVGDRNRGSVIRQFIAWYVRTPGVTLPRRPPPDK